MKRIVIFGGSGFVGRHLTHHLAGQGHQCLVVTRHAQRHRDLMTSATVVEADPYDPGSLHKLLQDCDIAVNLVGILNASAGNGFRRVHVELVEKVVTACREAGVRRLLHMSALNADQSMGSSQYLRTRGEGENRAHTLGQPDIAVTSFRPSVIFGLDDSFLNRFAALVQIPGPLPLACPDVRFAPVYVGDVVAAFSAALLDRSTFGMHYELCGPDVYTLREIIRLVAFHKKVYKHIIGLPEWAARLQAQILQYAPGKPLTPDNLDSLRKDSVCSENGLARLGIDPTPMAPLAARYLEGRDLNSLRIERRRVSQR